MSERADRYKESKEALVNSQTLYSTPGTRSSATIARVGTSYKDLVPQLSFGVFIRSINENIHDLTHREAISDIWNIMRRPEIRQAIEGIVGQNAWIQMKRWLQEISAPEQVGDPGGRNLLRKLRGNIALAAMGFKVSTMLCQVTGITQSHYCPAK